MSDDVVDTTSQTGDSTVGARGFLLYGLAHASIFLVTDFECGGVCSEEGFLGGATRQNVAIFEEADVMDPKLSGARGSNPTSINSEFAWVSVLPNSQEVVKCNCDEFCCSDIKRI